MLRTKRDLPEKQTLSLDATDTCIVHKETGIVHHAQQPKLTSRLHFTCTTDREKNKGRVADGLGQRTGRHNLNRLGSQSICACHPNIVSQHCHITQSVTVVGVNVVVRGCSSQQQHSSNIEGWLETEPYATTQEYSTQHLRSSTAILFQIRNAYRISQP